MSQVLSVRITGDATGFERAMGRAKATAGKFSSAISSTLGKLGIGIGAAGAIAYLRNLATELDNIGDNAAKMGIGVEFFQKLNYAGRMTNVTMEQVGTALRSMQANIVNLGRGAGQAEYVFRKLGIEAEDIQDLDQEAQFKKLGRALLGVKNETERAALAQMLFGRSGKDLLPLFAQYEKYAAELEEKGLIFTPEEIAAAERFNDAMVKIGQAIKVIVVRSGALEKVAEILGTIADIVMEPKKMKTELKTGVKTAGVTGALGMAEQAMRSGLLKYSLPGMLLSKMFPEDGKEMFGTGDYPITQADVLAELKKIREKLPDKPGHAEGEVTP